MAAYNHTKFAKFSLLYGLLALPACTGIAPVQEMSNARQTLNLARGVKAQIYAQERYSKAQEFLEQAVNQLNSGDYHQARKLALQATHEAKQAHLIALDQRKK